MICRKVIIDAAKEVGFDLVGVLRADSLVEERKSFEEWLLAGNNSSLSYLERNVEKRFDARLLMEGCRSIIICAVSYLSPISRGYDTKCVTKVASYAVAKDYHVTIKQMLSELAVRLKLEIPELRFRAFTDSAPVAEKSLAVRAGFGWIGRNSLLVTPKYGSMILLGELLLDCDVDEYDKPMSGVVGCGSCRACVDSCPNSAILDNRSIDTHRCISCRTIEREQQGSINLGGWIFGCDACQSVCPFNRHAPLHTNPLFDPLFDPRKMDAKRWLTMSEEEFDELASQTPMTRAGLERIKSNIKMD